MEVVEREFIYLWYYFTLQLSQIAKYWAVGVFIGSCISVFGNERLRSISLRLQGGRFAVLGVIAASLIGIASPLCMYGTIPVAASFSEKGVASDWLAAFMMSSILLNPQLIVYSAALGPKALALRVISCFLTGVAAGLAVRYFARNRTFFNFSGFAGKANRDLHPNPFLRLLMNIGRNIRATGLFFLAGVALSALFQRYMPQSALVWLFGGNRTFGVLMAATIGVPVYACGGATIPLLQNWLASGMSLGAAAAFMLTGPATKITNLGALKIVLGRGSFACYLLFVMLSALTTGLLATLLP